jgi:hypothetical protein
VDLHNAWTRASRDGRIRGHFRLDADTVFQGVQLSQGTIVETGIEMSGSDCCEYVAFGKRRLTLRPQQRQVGDYLVRYCPGRVLRPRRSKGRACPFRCDNPACAESLHRRCLLQEVKLKNLSYRFFPNGALLEPRGHVLMVENEYDRLPHRPQQLTREFLEDMVEVSRQNPEWICFWNDLAPAGGTVDHAHAQLVNVSCQSLPIELAILRSADREGGISRLSSYPAAGVVFGMNDVGVVADAAGTAAKLGIRINLIALGRIGKLVLFPRRADEAIVRELGSTPAAMELAGMIVTHKENVYRTLGEPRISAAQAATTHLPPELEAYR